MKRFINIILGLSIVVVTLVFTLTFVSCTQDEPNKSPYVTPEDEPAPARSTLLIYAVATNSLSGNLIQDKNEMLAAGHAIDIKNNNVLVFETKYHYDETSGSMNGNEVNLLKLVADGDDFKWQAEKVFNDEVASLSPERISEIISYVKKNYPAEEYGLMFWSHSTASQPYLSVIPDESEEDENSLESISDASMPQAYSFGQDKTYTDGDPYYQINIDSLASAIPNNLFDFIWFDSCYMSNIETIYQFRGKCNYFVGYPTEVLEFGLPYDLVLPYLVGDNKDLVTAASIFYNYYSTTFGTIAVIDMTNIERLAETCKEIFQKGQVVSSSSLMTYSRYTTGPFYDFSDYVKEMAISMGKNLQELSWDDILESVVIYKATTTQRYLPSLAAIDEERFSGISSHLYSFGVDSKSEKYYKSLDWFNTVFRDAPVEEE